MAENYKTGNVMPLVEIWQNLSCFLASAYISPEKWSLGDLEREYSKVMSLIEHEYKIAKENQFGEGKKDSKPKKRGRKPKIDPNEVRAYAKNKPQLTHKQIAEHFKCNRSTISKILKNRCE